ncbi:MAG: hypothetical protein J0M24_21430 [Verrucomicrobia bacterium]|nr:hypothetical protein [Verrucomicrobiota bacterium]
MSSFDPTSVRQAVAAFTPRRPQIFQELSSAKDVMIELRQECASFRAIAELLTQRCLPIPDQQDGDGGGGLLPRDPVGDCRAAARARGA